MTLNEQIELLQAIAAGKTIQATPFGKTAWVDLILLIPGAAVDFSYLNDYRIKPEPRVVWINSEFPSGMPGSWTCCYSDKPEGPNWTKFVEAIE